MTQISSLVLRFVRRAPVSLVGAVCLLVPAMASAQLSTSRGLSFGAHLLGTSISVEDGDAQSGGGLGVRAGYGVNRIVTVFLQIDGSQIDIEDSGADVAGNWQLAHADIGARFHFASTLRRWVPYLDASFGARTVSVSDAVIEGENQGKVSFTGPAFTAGGGISIFFKPTLAFDASLKWSTGSFDEVKVGSVSLRDLDIDATTARFGLGLMWWP